jgi:acetyl esterase/lipase
MTKLVGLHPEGMALDPPVWVVPGKGAIGMPPPTTGYQTNPAVNGLVGATKAYFDRNSVIAHRRNDRARGMTYTDYVSRAISARNYWQFNATPIDTYSCRFYWSCPSNDSYIGAFRHLITFMSGGPAGTDRFSLMQDDYTNLGGFWQANRPMVMGETATPILYNPANNFKMSATTTWRVEIQVQPTAPKVTIKIYDWTSTVASQTIQVNPTSVSADTFMLGRHPSTAKCGTGFFIALHWYGDVEIFNTYNLDGTAGQHRETPVNKWYEMVGGVETPVDEAGTIISGALSTTDKNNWHDSAREFIYSASDYTVVPFYYDQPRTVRRGILYHRNDTPPPGGWPLVSFWHGGFFAGGDFNDMSQSWMKWLLFNGFAVSTGEWIVGTPVINMPPVYLALASWPNQYSGRYPSFYIDPKLLALHMIEHGQQGNGDYPINTDKMCIVGHSAGAAIALGAAVSRDLTLGSYDLTVNNTSYGYRTATADPEFKCAYVFSPPTDMKWAYDNDPTHPNFGVANQGVGVLRATACTYMGLAYNTTLTTPMMANTRITDMIAAQTPSKLPPVGIVSAINDGVVPLQHTQFAVDALAAKGVTADTIYTRYDHDESYFQGPQQHFLNFLEANGMT